MVLTKPSLPATMNPYTGLSMRRSFLCVYKISLFYFTVLSEQEWRQSADNDVECTKHHNAATGLRVEGFFGKLKLSLKNFKIPL